jgi:hypothetical protein
VPLGSGFPLRAPVIDGATGVEYLGNVVITNDVYREAVLRQE